MASPFSTRAWKERCDALANRLLGYRKIGADDVKAQRPGGANNPTRDAGAWLAYYTWLVRHDAASGRGPAMANDAVPTMTEAEQVDTLRGRPVAVTLVTPLRLSDGRALEVVRVHAKGLEALIEADELDHDIRTLATYNEWLKLSARAEDDDLRHRIGRELLRTQSLLVWLAIEGRGEYTAECPYDPDAPNVTPPAYLYSLDPFDLPRILTAFVALNGARLVAIARLLQRAFGDDAPTTSSPSWATFVAQRELEMNAPAAHLAKRWPLAATALSAGLRARAAHEAQQHATATPTNAPGS